MECNLTDFENKVKKTDFQQDFNHTNLVCVYIHNLSLVVVTTSTYF